MAASTLRDKEGGLANLKGNFLSPFRSSLGFGKLSYEPSPSQSYELSYNIRHETDVVSFGGTNSYQFANNQGDDVNSVILKHRRTGSKLLEEATFNFQRYRRRFGPVDSTLVALLLAWELLALRASPRSQHPTISSFVETIEQNHVGRIVMFFLWLWLGWTLAS